MRARVLALPAATILVGALLLRHSVLAPFQPLAPAAAVAHAATAVAMADDDAPALADEPELAEPETDPESVEPDEADHHLGEPALPDESINTIHGRIKTSAGDPIGGVLITATRGDIIANVVTSDDEGYYALRQLPSGTYTVTFVYGDMTDDAEIEVDGEVYVSSPIFDVDGRDAHEEPEDPEGHLDGNDDSDDGGDEETEPEPAAEAPDVA